MATSSVQRILFDLSSVDKMQHPRSPDSPGDKRKQIRINTNNNKCRANMQSATVATDESFPRGADNFALFAFGHGACSLALQKAASNLRCDSIWKCKKDVGPCQGSSAHPNGLMLQYSPISLRLFLIMMSVTASNTNCTFLVSVAQVKWV